MLSLLASAVTHKASALGTDRSAHRTLQSLGRRRHLSPILACSSPLQSEAAPPLHWTASHVVQSVKFVLKKHESQSQSESAIDGSFPVACSGSINRRMAVACLIFVNLAILSKAKAEGEKNVILESYVDEMEGFTLLVPSDWSKVDKAGATVLFEDPQSKGNNLGVVVNPVRISSLREFGPPDTVADKLLQAEMKKPSTNNVQLINVKERQVHGAVPLYQLEYKLDSSRGTKHIFSAVTVASKKLYILNIAVADSLEKPLSPNVASVLDQIANSFDLLN